jgi:hypothetical protein
MIEREVHIRAATTIKVIATGLRLVDRRANGEVLLVATPSILTL